MLTLRARWVLPIAGPAIADGWVAVRGGRIAAVGAARRTAPVRDGVGPDVLDLGHVALLPAVVNAHTHLELSYLAGQVGAAAQFTTWIRALMARRRQEPDARAPHIAEAARAAVAHLRAWGTALVGDVSNTGISIPLLGDAGMRAAVFLELVRFRGSEADAALEEGQRRMADVTPAPHVRVSLAPHAPYSVSPRLFQAIRRELDRHPLARTTVHVAESPEEQTLLLRGEGPWRDLLVDFGVWDDTWTPPRCGAVEYLDRMRVLDERTLAVHLVQASAADLERLAARGATVVACPRSNRHVGVGDPPVAAFYESGVAVAVGTDSLASAPDLGVWNELPELRRLAPGVPAARLLESATLAGARALGFGEDYGSIEPGKVAALVAVDVPEHVVDVEEYLVKGIDRSAIRWVGETPLAADVTAAETVP